MDEHERVEPAFTMQRVEALQHGPPADVHFVGVLSADSRLNHTTVPTTHQSHKLVKDHFFYTVPQQLLESVCFPQVGESFDVDDDLLQLELDLSQISADHGLRVGFWDNIPILCNLMHVTPIRREDLAEFGWTKKQVDEILKKANDHLLSFSQISCGYAGWLMTNPVFLLELEVLSTCYGDQMRRWGTALVGLPIPSSQPAGCFNPTDQEGWNEYDSAVLEFCARWRLLGLAGPRIPVPMRPMMSGRFPLSIVEQLMRAGGVFNWPDTFPVFARDELRDLLTQALNSSSGSRDHLAGWRKIVDLKNKAKNQIPALERQFRFQHFWRLLRERHPNAFKRRLNRIELAFAQYLGVDDSTVRLDRQKIANSLGKDWDLPDKPAVRRPR